MPHQLVNKPTLRGQKKIMFAHSNVTPSSASHVETLDGLDVCNGMLPTLGFFASGFNTNTQSTILARSSENGKSLPTIPVHQFAR